jgi:four helix bundle protein
MMRRTLRWYERTGAPYQYVMTYEDWELRFPAALKADVIWRVQAFRLASYAGDCAEEDTRAPAADARFAPIAAQLCRAAGSIPANIAEGYSRRSPRDRVRFYEYALGSTGESKSWYVRLGPTLDPAVFDARLELLQSVTRLLQTMIRSTRG